MRHLKSGRLACVSTLDAWPRTLHERCTFTVDLTMCNPQIMVFTVTGLFKELTEAAEFLRHFVRTFVVVPQNAGFCIRNETIFITSATAEQTSEFERSQTINSSANSIQSQTATNISPNISQLSDEAKMQMVRNMSAQRQMNIDWSHKCLEETNWEFNRAIFVFQKLFKENQIPPEAFNK